MDVTYGLLLNLVKTKSIQRILAPIASQISLLIILNESDNTSSLQNGDMVPCAQAVVEASNKLIIVAKQQAHSSTDSEFIAQTLSSCEVLDLSCTNLYLASERLENAGVSKEAKNKLIQASKDVLQGTMKVLLVADDAEIRHLVASTNIVTEKLGIVSGVNNMPALVQCFKEYTEALSVLTGLADKRQRDLIHSKQTERIITSLNILKKTMSSLSTAMQNFVKYPNNPQAQTGKSFIINEILTAIQDIVEAVQDRDAEENIVVEEPGKFVTNIDQALESVSEDKRHDLHNDFEMWVEEIVRHSMTVAHMCHDGHRDLIIKTCQRVMQVKNRVLEMRRNMLAESLVPQMRDDYTDVCEMLTDEFCELEKNVNISLLHLVVEHFKETTEPLERLVKKAVYSQGRKHCEKRRSIFYFSHNVFERFLTEKSGLCGKQNEMISQDDLFVNEFQEHAEKICQIASLAAASSTDSGRVYSIRSSIQRLENLDPEIIPAAINISKKRHDKAAVRHLKLLMKEWTFELTNLIVVLDEMTDPKMFMLVSERRVEDDINSSNGCILIADQPCFHQLLQSIIGRSRRVVTVAERIVDNSDDAMFRNGLMVFVQQLKKAITAVRTAGTNLGENFQNKTLQDTMRRRSTFLLDSLIKVKLGLNESNHPHVLSPLRRNVRGTKSKDIAKQASPKITSSKFLKKLMPTAVESIIATSAPKLSLPVSPVEEIITSSVEREQNSKPVIPKSQSAIHISQATPNPQTYAWKLSHDLVTWSTKGDKPRVNVLCADLLGWTNHIAEVFMCIKQHCADLNKKRQNEAICEEIDELTPQILEEAKYVLHGDFSVLNSLKTHTECWATKIEKVRVFVDITVDQWKSVTDKICVACQARQTDIVKHQLKLIQDHKEALVDLVTITEKFRWENQVKGQHLIDTLTEEKNDLENLTVTLKTTSEMILDNETSGEITELEQLGREWSVKVYFMRTHFEQFIEELLNISQERKLWMNMDKCDNLTDFLQEEIKKLKDLMKSACYGEVEKKELYSGYLADMKDSVEDIKTASIKNSTISMVTMQYTKFKIGLYRGFWILKAVHCIDLARQQTVRYCASVDVLIEGAFCVKGAKASDRQREEDRFKTFLDCFTNVSAVLRKKVLHNIQLSTELEKRSIVRQCLDAITTLTPHVVMVINTFAGSTDSECIGQVINHRLLWSAKLKHLFTVLQQMTDIKSSLIPELHKLLEPKNQPPECLTISAKLQNGGTVHKQSNQQESLPPQTSLTAELQGKFDLNKNFESHDVFGSPDDILYLKPAMSHGTESGSQLKRKGHGNISVHKPGLGHKAGTCLSRDRLIDDYNQFLGADMSYKLESFEPVTVDMKSIEDQIILNARQLSEENRDLQIKEEEMAVRSPIKPTQDVGKPFLTMLKDAEYLEREAQRWEDENNPIVKVAQTMALQISHMTQYIRRTGPITSHLGLVTTSKAVSDNARKIVNFAKILIRHCVDERFCTDLKSHCSLVPTVIQQLSILSNVQLGTAKADIADRILVENSQNLMKKILDMISACEAVCVKGLKTDVGQDSENAVLLALEWRRKHTDYYKQELAEGGTIDELGLRRVENEIPPPSLSQIFRT